MNVAPEVINALHASADPLEIACVDKFFKGGDPATKVMGAPMGKVFPVAKKLAGLGLDAVETLLDDAHYEARMAAVAILDFKVRDRKLTPDASDL